MNTGSHSEENVMRMTFSGMNARASRAGRGSVVISDKPPYVSIQDSFMAVSVLSLLAPSVKSVKAVVNQNA